MAPADLPIILFQYVFSPYARRIQFYLALRRIPYMQCLQPPVLPRPDVAQLGIKYRRIPLLSIGKDVYLDTRLILQKLEELYPPSEAHPAISASTGDQRAIERLLSHFAIDAGIFLRAAQLLPTDMPLMKDPKFLKDRADLAGAPPGAAGPMSKEVMEARRPEAVAEIRDAMELLETTLLADGRDWVLKTAAPTLADIEAVWVFSWLMMMPGALPADVVGPKQFPKVFAYVARFTKAVEARRKEVGKTKTIKGDEAVALIAASDFAEPEGDVDTAEPWVAAEGLKKGDLARLWPTDTGANHKDEGKLVSVSTKESVIEVSGKAGNVRVHAPRHGFRVKKASKGSAKL